jgi:predicted Zn-dependent protease with MMP-like domain
MLIFKGGLAISPFLRYDTNQSIIFEKGGIVMTAKAISRQEIIMNFTTPPSPDDIAVFAKQALESLPDELASKCEELILEVEEFPDDATAQDMELDTLYELLALYHSAKEISPGVQKKIANGEDKIVIYRRPILDVWCETGEDLGRLVREIIIEELARGFEFSDDDIQDMIANQR